MIRVLRWWRRVREGLWFIPTAIVLAAVALALALIEVDLRVAPDLQDRLPMLFGAGADGSREMLATVAGSMVTVAGTVFSITLVVLSLASSQYSSRVLRNFLADRTNQTVLGVFVGVFAYCLVVMRTIRSGDEGAIVPALAVLGGVVLAFVGIGYLIYFIHHISTAIQASEILARIADATGGAVEHLFPEPVGTAPERVPTGDPADGRPGHRWFPVTAERTGYVQEVNAEALIGFAVEKRSVVRMERGVGEFVIAGTPLVSVLAATDPEPADAARLRAVYAVDRQRTLTQDAAYGVRQIVDVALKALSPGVNDTTTAVMCADYLAAVLARVARRHIESLYRYADGELRVLARGPSFAGLVGESLDQIRQNAAGNVAVLTRLLDVVDTLAELTADPDRRRVLLDHARATEEAVRRTVPAPYDHAPLLALAARLTGRLGDPAPARQK